MLTHTCDISIRCTVHIYIYKIYTDTSSQRESVAVGHRFVRLQFERGVRRPCCFDLWRHGGFMFELRDSQLKQSRCVMPTAGPQEAVIKSTRCDGSHAAKAG